MLLHLRLQSLRTWQCSRRSRRNLINCPPGDRCNNGVHAINVNERVVLFPEVGFGPSRLFEETSASVNGIFLMMLCVLSYLLDEAFDLSP